MVVLPTEASVRCGLKGQYRLVADEDVLVLQDPETKKTVMQWPYVLLRRYGRDKVSGTIINWIFIIHLIILHYIEFFLNQECTYLIFDFCSRCCFL